MRPIFAETGNVRRFILAINNIRNYKEDVPSMALVYSDPGLGKTRTAIWYAAKEGGIYLKTKKLMSGRWLLEEFVGELGEAPLYRTSDLFRQVIEQLMLKPRSVFIDEIDYLTYDSRIIETLRDIHDITHVPIIFIGMGMADKRLMRYRHLWDRFSEVVKFMPLTRQDVQSVIAQMCEVKLSSAAIDYLYQQTAGSFRSLIVYMHRAEYLGRLNNLEEIEPRDLKIRDLLC